MASARAQSDTESGLTAVQSTIAGAVKWAVSNVSFVSAREDSSVVLREKLEIKARQKFPHLMLHPLQETSHVLSLMFEEHDRLDNTSDHFSILQIPAVRVHCKSAPMEAGTANMGPNVYVSYKERAFLKAFAQVVASVLGLSLYQHPELLRVFTLLPKSCPGRNRLTDAIETALKYGAKAFCPAQSLLDNAMVLIGHYQGRASAEKPVVMSSFNGQSVYLNFLETTTVIKRGYMSLFWLPGVIWHGADKHHLVQSELHQDGNFHDWGQVPKPVNKPMNLLQGASLKWMVKHDGRRKGLGLILAIDGHKDSSCLRSTGVGGVMTSLAESVILETCPHDKTSCIAERLASRCHYMVPGTLKHAMSNGPEMREGVLIRIVAVDGNDALRFYSCADVGGKPVVFRGDACLSCCVEVCIKAGFSFVIL